VATRCCRQYGKLEMERSSSWQAGMWKNVGELLGFGLM